MTTFKETCLALEEGTPEVLPDHSPISTVSVGVESVVQFAVVAAVIVVFGSENHSCPSRSSGRKDA